MSGKYAMLIVDDVEMNRALLGKIFGDEYTIFTAADGKQAMEELGRQEINIVLLDLSMPEMDGYQVIQAMKLEPRFSEIPIVVTTGVLDGSERRAFDLGADDFVTKPYDPYIVKKRVDNLTRKYILQMENLRQALDHAEQLAHAKADYLSEMSHEIRSPINAIVSTCSLMEENYQNPIQVQTLNEKICDSAKYLLGVINSVLDSAALENKKIVLTKSPFDFRNMIQSISAMFFAQCREKSIRFDLNMADITDEYLFGDPTRLKQVLVNLVSNAIKFTPEGGSIDVRVEQLAHVGSMVKLRFSVTDSGPGIQPEKLDQIWDAYAQEDDAVQQTYGGTGLGLSIVRQITEVMGGTVSVRSQVGTGSTFAVEIPFTVSQDLPVLPKEKLQSVRALIIDDDPETQKYARQVLSRLGITCQTVESGAQALDAMSTAFDAGKGFDICFVDWRMPGMSGIDITRAIRTRFDDDTVVVIVSAYDTSEIEDDAFSAGANAVVPKPMFQSTVFDLLMNITGGQREQDWKIAENYHFDGLRVLLAEDNNINAEVSEEILRMAGFCVDRAENGVDAVKRFTQSDPGTYAAVLMDIQMPLLDGHAATRQIRASAHPDAKTVPIIAVTANAFTADVRASLAAGMNAHVSKPVVSKKLYDTLDTLIFPAAQ